MCFWHFDFEMCFAPQRRALFRHLNFQKSSDTEVFCTFWLGNVLRATTACTFSTSQLPKSGPRMVCFVYFHLEMCFAPQRRALFRHRNFQKCSDHGVLCTFSLRNVASHHNGVQFFISHLASWLGTRRFSEPTFRPSGASNHWKNTVLRDFPTFSRICIFFLLTLSLLIFSLLIFLFSLPLPCSAFHLSILSEVWLLNFLRLYIHCIYNVVGGWIMLNTINHVLYIHCRMTLWSLIIINVLPPISVCTCISCYVSITVCKIICILYYIDVYNLQYTYF